MNDVSQPLKSGRAERGEETRQRLLLAAIDVFGRQGFEVGTRTLASAAGVNLAAIPYHFGSKQGLYLAVAEHIGEQIHAQLAGPLEKARNALAVDAASDDDSPLDAAQARALLTRILEAQAQMLIRPESASWARIIIREQMDPSEAFERLYDGFIHPTFEVIAGLVARIMGRKPDDEEVRLHVPRLFGAVLVFRAARATVLRELRWSDIGKREFNAIRGMIRANVESLADPSIGRS